MAEQTKVVRSDDEQDASDAKGATEDQVEKINTIKGGEVLGYKGEAREEHSGQNSPRRVPGLEGDLADNDPSEL
jgi:hypothetical protein